MEHNLVLTAVFNMVNQNIIVLLYVMFLLCVILNTWKLLENTQVETYEHWRAPIICELHHTINK